MTREFLVFTLAGPLMAFGDIAPGERRVSADRPGRSALLGMFAASLGMLREDPNHKGLAESIAFAVRIDSLGVLLNDYHTVQSAPARKNQKFATRRDELQVNKLGTILSQRAYRADAAFTIAAVLRQEGPASLLDIAKGLKKPLLPIHAGRRACPLGLPPAPEVLSASTAVEAFRIYDGHQDEVPARRSLRSAVGVGATSDVMTLSTEEFFVEESLLGDARVQRRELRRDEPVSRTRWQFAPRTEVIAHIGTAG